MGDSMMETAYHYDAVCRAMSEPAFYPHPVAGPERRDTHISTVFLTGDRAYKIKKPVNLGFLDFRDLSDRYYFCRQEVRLNRRLSSGVYHYVRPVYRASDGKASFKPNGPIVEYVVCMRELPESVRLDVMLHNNRIRTADMEMLGGCLADFYRTCTRSGKISKYGTLNTIRTNIEENFTQLAPFAQELFDPDPWLFICQVSRTVMDKRSELFAHRVRIGAVCDGHGDLRCEHIYLDNGIQIIDCIEFNDRFRYGDVALDLAFLKMDLDYRHQSRHGLNLIDAYVENSADLGIYSLIDFYAAYRAIVRLKIVCLQSASNGACLQSRALQRADRYLDLAYC